MGFFIGLMLLVGFIALVLSDRERKKPILNYTPSNPTPPLAPTSQVISSKPSIDLPNLSSDLKLIHDKYTQLYRSALALYQREQLEAASVKFSEASNLMIKIQSRYPNNLRVNFDLLEAYQGFSWNKAIHQAFKCLEITDKLLQQEGLTQQKSVAVIFCRCDVMRKLYKLLIKENRMNDARSILGDLLKTINIIMKDNPPPYANHDVKIRMLSLSQDGLFASFFLNGLREGRDVRRNLITSPLTASDSPELGHYFDAKFSAADSEMLSMLREYGM